MLTILPTTSYNDQFENMIFALINVCIIIVIPVLVSPMEYVTSHVSKLVLNQIQNNYADSFAYEVSSSLSNHFPLHVWSEWYLKMNTVENTRAYGLCVDGFKKSYGMCLTKFCISFAKTLWIIFL